MKNRVRRLRIHRHPAEKVECPPDRLWRLGRQCIVGTTVQDEVHQATCPAAADDLVERHTAVAQLVGGHT